MRTADLLVRCLEGERVEIVFGLPGEETADLLDALARSSLRFILTRHEQGAVFMADVYGRLTGMPGVCLVAPGAGATNLVTGLADAYLDRAPLVALTGQSGLERAHQEAHPSLDAVALFRPVTKWTARVETPALVPELIRRAFKIAQAERPGPTHLEIPEDVAAAPAQGAPLPVRPLEYPPPDPESVLAAAEILARARHPLILAGSGVLRANASGELRLLARTLQAPVAHTLMAKGALSDEDPLSLMTVGLQERDHRLAGFEAADVVLTAGYDPVEYGPHHWNPRSDKVIIHVDTLPAEVDRHYIPAVEVIGDLRDALSALAAAVPARSGPPLDARLRDLIVGELQASAADDSFPLKPQRVVADLARALEPEDVVLCDVGLHKLWLARLYPARAPNTVLFSHALAAMGIALPGAIAAKLVRPTNRVVAVCGDGGFLMTVQEMETARRLNLPLVVVVWSDGRYGAVARQQQRRFGRTSGTLFSNPDLPRLAEAFGWIGRRLTSAADLYPALTQALATDEPVLLEVPIDPVEADRLAARLGEPAITV
jgi:acetolactate synthase-1/2/3 large subunit